MSSSSDETDRLPCSFGEFSSTGGSLLLNAIEPNLRVDAVVFGEIVGDVVVVTATDSPVDFFGGDVVVDFVVDAVVVAVGVLILDGVCLRRRISLAVCFLNA